MYGGIGGTIDTWHNDPINVSNSYNIGKIVVTNGDNGGIFGSGNGVAANLIINNFYNAGAFEYTVSKTNANSYSLTRKPGTKTNTYFLNNINARYFDTGSIEIDSDTLKSDSFATSLGELWVQSGKGYPILKWQLKE